MGGPSDGCQICLLAWGFSRRNIHGTMDNFILDIGFSKCHTDPNVYTKKLGSHLIILVLYVDDLILTGIDPKLLNHVKTNLKKKFK
jgi:hypothetical protein